MLVYRIEQKGDLNMSNGRVNGRVLTSLSSLGGFLLLFLTGVILYVEPHGRVAYWTKWSFLGMEKDQWGNIHIFSGLLFLVAGGFHIYYNWKPLLNYISKKIGGALGYKRELFVSGLIVIWIVVSGILAIPPLVYVTDLGETVKNSWVSSPDLEPPFGHAELVSLQTFCKKQRIPLDQAMLELRKAGFRVPTPKSTLAEIALSKKSSGMGVYKVIKKLEAKPEVMRPGGVWTAEKVEETFSGTGLGNKTVGQMIKKLGLNPSQVYERLTTAKINAEDQDKLKNLAEKNDTTPIKLMTVILVGEDQSLR